MHLEFSVVGGLVEAVFSGKFEFHGESGVGAHRVLHLGLVPYGQRAQLAQHKVLMQSVVGVGGVVVVVLQVLLHTTGRLVRRRHPLGVQHFADSQLVPLDLEVGVLVVRVTLPQTDLLGPLLFEGLLGDDDGTLKALGHLLALALSGPLHVLLVGPVAELLVVLAVLGQLLFGGVGLHHGVVGDAVVLHGHLDETLGQLGLELDDLVGDLGADGHIPVGASELVGHLQTDHGGHGTLVVLAELVYCGSEFGG